MICEDIGDWVCVMIDWWRSVSDSDGGGEIGGGGVCGPCNDCGCGGGD